MKLNYGTPACIWFHPRDCAYQFHKGYDNLCCRARQRYTHLFPLVPISSIRDERTLGGFGGSFDCRADHHGASTRCTFEGNQRCRSFNALCNARVTFISENSCACNSLLRMRHIDLPRYEIIKLIWFCANSTPWACQTVAITQKSSKAQRYTVALFSFFSVGKKDKFDTQK